MCGVLSVSDAVLCHQLNKLFNQFVGRSIEQIGDLDVSFSYNFIIASKSLAIRFSLS